ncbi:hypothetical protein BHE74_00034278 [Ensete ventricosum]|nr:hypothetical protein BHE74_00034278 [Ensete ventricosum]
MDYRIKQLQEELDALKSNGGLKAVAKAEERASELQQELEKTKRERGEELLRREAAKKELHEVRCHLGDAQRLLKEARVRARKMDDELLQAVKSLESARAELPRQSVVQYKKSLGFKEGLKRMSRVTYEYGYRVVLARFHARHPDVEVEEDPFTIHPENDLVSIGGSRHFMTRSPPSPDLEFSVSHCNSGREKPHFVPDVYWPSQFEASFPRDRAGSLTSIFRSTRSPILTCRGRTRRLYSLVTALP